MLKSNKGITLVALVITIIVLLILAGVSISLVIGQDGILNKSKNAVNIYENAAQKEDQQLKDFEAQFDNYINMYNNKTTTSTDE